MEFLSQQLSAWVLLLFTGMALGVYFDLYRVFRSRIRVNRWIDACGDLFFWVLAAILAAPLLYWSTWLELRLYVWLTVGGGVAFYFLVFSRLMIPHYRRFWKLMTWAPGKLIQWSDRFATGIARLFQGLAERQRTRKGPNKRPEKRNPSSGEAGKHPEGFEMHPEESGKHPEGSGKHPEGSGKHPEGSGKHPEGSGKHPEGSGKHPEGSGKHPEGSGKHPEGSGKHPEGSGKHPEGSGKHPEGSGKHPEESGKHPEGSGKHPGELRKRS